MAQLVYGPDAITVGEPSVAKHWP